jgi:hypothetical protein
MMKDKLEQIAISLIAGLSVLISLLDWLGVLEGISFLSQRIPNLTLLSLGLIAGYLVFERRSKLDRIEQIVVTGFEDNQRRILRAFTLGQLLYKDEKLHTTIHQITEHYLSVQSCDFDLFRQRSEDALLECRDVLRGLKRGYLETEVAGKYSYGRRDTEAAQTSLKAIDYEDIEAWRTDHLDTVLQANVEAKKRNVTIERVFILCKESFDKGKDIIKKHKEAGADVYVISPEDLPSTRLLQSYMIVDDHIPVYFYLTRDGKRSREEKITIDPAEVDKAITAFNAVRRCAKKLEVRDLELCDEKQANNS